MRKTFRPEPTTHQISELLCDWGIPPTEYRIDMARAFLLHRRGFHLSVVMIYLEKRGYVNDPVRLASEIKPFLHRKLLRPIKGLIWNSRYVERYIIAKPRIENPAYLPLFKKDKSKYHYVQGSRPRQPMTLMQY
jgi:hypothetical protein